MKHVRCIVDSEDFTKGKIYDVSYIDNDGDIWVKQDDTGHEFFMFPDECEFIGDDCPHCNGSGKR